MVMNGCSETVSQTNNQFSNFPLFFLSDPPHLIKKLRNNVYKSGYKEDSSRYTRCLLLNSKYILWEHIYSVYLRDKKRHLFSTDIRSSHVHLDSLSKMRVKLAVQVLNSKVQKDMAKYENDSTESTQKFILNCETLFNCFNDTEPLLSLEDTRIKALDNVLQFFQNWRDQLTSIFETKSEQSYHFISWQTMFDLQVTINGFKELVKFIGNDLKFTSLHGSHLYIIPKRISQDLVESFFSVQRQACGGSNNMTAYTYGYNVNGFISYSEAKCLSKKQTNVYEVDEIEISQAQKYNHASVPKRKNCKGIFSQLWPVHL